MKIEIQLDLKVVSDLQKENLIKHPIKTSSRQAIK
jgi:hypothetical protein